MNLTLIKLGQIIQNKTVRIIINSSIIQLENKKQKYNKMPSIFYTQSF